VINRNEAVRRSITATLREIQDAYERLKLPPDRYEIWEVTRALAYIEAQINEAQLKRRADNARDVAVDEATHGS
jgi:predicted metalloprotease with PDZ domain